MNKQYKIPSIRANVIPFAPSYRMTSKGNVPGHLYPPGLYVGSGNAAARRIAPLCSILIDGRISVPHLTAKNAHLSKSIRREARKHLATP
jgi:hypothetical protein